MLPQYFSPRHGRTGAKVPSFNFASARLSKVGQAIADLAHYVRLSAISKPCRDAVDGELNAAQDLLIRFVGAMLLQ